MFAGERTRARERNLWLDLVRIGAAVAVFVMHQQVAGGIQLGDVGYNGRLGVYVFFVLSGHLVGGLYRPGNVRGYALRRLARIVPAYYLAVIGITLLTGDSDFARQPAAYLTFTQTWLLPLPYGPLHPTWTLASEMAFYVLVPFLARYPAIAYLLAIPSFAASTIAPEFPLSAIWAFAIGMAAARIPLPPAPAAILGGMGLAAGFVIGNPLLIAAGTGGLIRAATRLPASSVVPVAIAADMTYAFYLWHESVLESLHLSGPVLVVVGFAVSAAVSAASLFVLERPILSAVTLRTGRAGAAARERAALQSSEEAAL